MISSGRKLEEEEGVDLISKTCLLELINNLRKPLRKRKIAHKYGSLHISNRDAGRKQ